MMKKTAVLLVNLGTPNSPSLKNVRKYLAEFLNDKRVIDLPFLRRKFLVNCIIVPFRVKNSSKIYQKLWTKEGSPLLLYGIKVQELLQERMPKGIDIYLAMRYQNPNISNVLEQIRLKNYNKIIIIPMYPQYASSSTGSTLEKAMAIIKNWYVIPEVTFVSQYFDEEGFIDTIVENAKKFDLNAYEHFLFSYHGLPERQVDKVYNDNVPCKDHYCENKLDETNLFCYKATCYATTRLIAEKLHIPQEKYTVSFQSRLDKNWLTPFSDKVITQKGENGVKNLLVFSPAFTADCLETTIEISDEYAALFQKAGGKKLDVVESLNDAPGWIDTLEKMVKSRL
ncbi:ferrochelatase [Candidatus Haliotispira prima]|uniref:Ferrochelatase n=1 Tax=Candidatus Haliotispira prima TaxID=3034016 RepID=A0ABY8MJV6_9SPIO|nr:ferrochelatase [Candidatus Haliotispira prima]